MTGAEVATGTAVVTVLWLLLFLSLWWRDRTRRGAAAGGRRPALVARLLRAWRWRGVHVARHDDVVIITTRRRHLSGDQVSWLAKDYEQRHGIVTLGYTEDRAVADAARRLGWDL